MMNYFDTEDKYTSGLYSKHPHAMVKGEGASLWDDEGKEYIDCIGGHGVVNVGHANPFVVNALIEQAAKLISLPETFYHPVRAELMDRLCNMVETLDRVFFCNSGTEAIEGAIKFARLSTGRTGIIAAMRGFHGRTLGALSATWNKKYRDPFEPLVPEFAHVPFNNIDALEEAVTTNTAAVLLEIVQGEGGVHLADLDYLQSAQRICIQKGALLIIDEVQTGFGRTGKLFAFQHFQITPDIVCMAKSIAGGIPMGAILIGDKVTNLGPGYHGSTFGGNPLACAAALATLEFIEKENLVELSAENGAYFLNKIANIKSSVIRQVRGKGLMIGIELKHKVAPYLSLLEQNGVLALPAGLTVIRLLPPLVITRDQIDKVVDTLSLVLDSDLTQ